MSKSLGGIVVIIVIFLIGAWIGTKYPMTNLIGRATG